MPEILIIDDFEPSAFLLTAAFSAMKNIEIIMFTDPLVALEYFKNNHEKIVLVLSDDVMPVMTGVRLAGLIKDIADVPIMLYTGHEHWSNHKEKFHLFEKIILKPANLSSLLNITKNVLKEQGIVVDFETNL